MQTRKILTGAHVDRLIWAGDRAASVVLVTGVNYARIRAWFYAQAQLLRRNLNAFSLGYQSDLAALNIDTRQDMPEIGQNLHDHPGIGLHFQGRGTGHGLEVRQWAKWALSPLNYALFGRGPSPPPHARQVHFSAREIARHQTFKPISSHFIWRLDRSIR